MLKSGMTWWQPHIFERKKPYLETRIKLTKAVRGFFDGQDFWEVDTPALQVMPGAEVHVHAFESELLAPDLTSRGMRYLHTSPEFAMKKLLVAGLPKIYQMCHVYRNAEGSHMHSPEFTMLEWYRTGVDYHQIMDDTVALLRHVATTLNIDTYRTQGMVSDPFQEWEKVTVSKAFKIYAGIDLDVTLPQDMARLKPQAEAIGVRVSDTDTWDDLFFRIFMDRIEAKLGQGRPTILCDYPAHMAALSKVKASDPRFAERFEVYVCGIELANAFTELTDAGAQRARFEADMAQKHETYGAAWPVDDDFIAALAYGMPETGGIALGIDRLCMLASNADDIKHVLFCA